MHKAKITLARQMKEPEKVSVSREELDGLREQVSMFADLQNLANIGWWKVNFNEGKFYCSDYLARLFRFDSFAVDLDAFRELIHPYHVERVMNNLRNGIYDERFPVMTKKGFVWVHGKLARKEADADGNITALGYIQQIRRTTFRRFSGKSRAMETGRTAFPPQPSVSVAPYASQIP